MLARPDQTPRSTRYTRPRTDGAPSHALLPGNAQHTKISSGPQPTNCTLSCMNLYKRRRPINRSSALIRPPPHNTKRGGEDLGLNTSQNLDLSPGRHITPMASVASRQSVP
jgi:hypothetical protein